jgi:hypothetical protein
MMLLGPLVPGYWTKQETILQPVESHPPPEGPDASGIALGITIGLKHFQPDTATTHPLESGQVLERDRKVPSPLGVLGGKPATDKNRRQKGRHGSGKEIIWNSGTQEWKQRQRSEGEF